MRTSDISAREKKIEKCVACPRRCNALRGAGEKGYCNVSDKIIIARAALHMWEEPCISGENGSGAVFFSGCNLGCVYCQNKEISGGQRGKDFTIDELAEVYLQLQSQGANNINLVTPTHYAKQIIASLDVAKSKGLSIPVVYNTSSYENVETLKMLDGYVDVYLPDCKYYDDERAVKYSNAQNYFKTALKAIEEMYRQTGEPIFDERGIMTKGVVVRHLILPEGTKDSKNVIREIHERFGDNVYLSLMSQYTPMNSQVAEKYPELGRKITKREYERVIDYALELGVENAFIQEGAVADESFIPDWNLE